MSCSVSASLLLQHPHRGACDISTQPESSCAALLSLLCVASSTATVKCSTCSVAATRAAPLLIILLASAKPNGNQDLRNYHKTARDMHLCSHYVAIPPPGLTPCSTRRLLADSRFGTTPARLTLCPANHRSAYLWTLILPITPRPFRLHNLTHSSFCT